MTHEEELKEMVETTLKMDAVDFIYYIRKVYAHYLDNPLGAHLEAWCEYEVTEED